MTLTNLREICEKAVKCPELDPTLKPEVAIKLLDALETAQKSLEFYAGREDGDTSWQEPDQFVPYWTLWNNGDCVGGENAEEALTQIEKILEDLR